MSSSGGVGGQGAPEVLDRGMIRFNGNIIDPKNADALKTVTDEISSEQLNELKQQLAAWDLVLHGDAFVDAADSDHSYVVGGPDTEIEISEDDERLGDAMDGFRPGQSTWVVLGRERGTAGFDQSVTDAKAMFTNPTEANKARFFETFANYSAEVPNVHELLFLVFKESIQETNEDKKYFLMKLKEYNDMAEGLSGYLSELVDASSELSAKGEGEDYPDKVSVDVVVKEFDLSTLNADGKLVETDKESKSLDRAGLNNVIKELESMQETVRNKRQMASTSFQNFDQKSNQLYNLVSSVMKSMNEMRSGTVRNML